MIKLNKILSCDTKKCTGCGICELACSEEKERVYNPRKSRVKVIKLGLNTQLHMASVCRFCEDPACVRSCPRDALNQSDEGGIIIVDEEKCNGCGWCIEACKFGAITFDHDKKAVIVCDLCQDKINPQCIISCPFEALVLVTLTELAQKSRFSVTKSLFKES